MNIALLQTDRIRDSDKNVGIRDVEEEDIEFGTLCFKS